MVVFQIQSAFHIVRACRLGLLALEHCEPISSLKTNEDALQAIVIYAPEDDLTFCMTSTFRAYLKILMDWYGNARDRIEAYNLTLRVDDPEVERGIKAGEVSLSTAFRARNNG